MLKKFLPIILLILSVSSLHAQTRAYVVVDIPPNTQPVNVIDTSTNTVIASIPLADAFGIAVSPDGSRAYTTGSGTFSVIDTASNTVIASIPIQGGPAGLGFATVSPDGKNVYVPDDHGTVYVISTATNTIVATISINDEPSSLAITPDGSRAYVLGVFGTVSIVDTASNAVVQTIPVNSFEGTGVFPGIAITPDGHKVYFLGLAVPNANVIDTATNTVSTIPLGDNFCSFCTNAIAITPDGSRVYVADNSNQVEVIDTATNTVDPTPIALASSPSGLAITPDGASVYTINFDGTISVVSTATNTVATTIQSGAPFGFPGIAIANLSTAFAAFSIDDLVINSNLHEQGDFTLGANTGGIDLAHQPLTLTVNNFSLTIPPGSFKQVGGNMHFVFNGTVNGLKVNFNLQAVHGSSMQFDFAFDVHGVSITGPNPANVSLGIGPNTGSTTAPF